MAGVLLASIPLASTVPGPSVLVVTGSPLLNRAAPDFALAELATGPVGAAATGPGGASPSPTPVRLSQYLGRPVIVNFWASWCGPCRDEFPQFVAARSQYASAGLEILGIVHQDSADAALAFATSHGATWPLLMDPSDVAWTAFRVSVGIPTTFFIDREGIVRAVSYGPVTPASLPGELSTIL